MYDSYSFSTETWNNCIKLVEGTPPSEFNWSFSEAAVWLWKFRRLLIEKLKRKSNLSTDDKEKALDYINKAKALEKMFREAAELTKDIPPDPL